MTLEQRRNTFDNPWSVNTEKVQTKLSPVSDSLGSGLRQPQIQSQCAFLHTAQIPSELQTRNDRTSLLYLLLTLEILHNIQEAVVNIRFVVELHLDLIKVR